MGVTVTELLKIASNVTVLVFVVTCMVTAGLGLTVRDMVNPFRRVRMVWLAVIANFILAPALAYLLTRMFALNESYEIGLLLLGGAAGAPFLPKLAELAKGDIAYSVGLMLLLMVVSILFMPLALPWMIPGLSADPWPLLRPLLFTMLLPLAAGMLVKSRSACWTSKLRPLFGIVSNVSMLAAVILLIGLNFGALLGTIGSGAAAIGALFVGISAIIGYALGGPSPGTRSVLGVGTGQRNVAAALLLATDKFADDPAVTVMILVTTLIGAIVLVFAAKWCARHTSLTPDRRTGQIERVRESDSVVGMHRDVAPS
jgi:BASS family bile acid:Na+ symporter